MLVLAVHGSAAPEATATIGRLAARLEQATGVRPVVGHLDVRRPTLDEVPAGRPGAAAVPGMSAGAGSGRWADAIVAARSGPDPWSRFITVSDDMNAFGLLLWYV